VDTVGECEKWRMQIIKIIGRKVMEIQNESLGEQRIRDLNDEINKYMREKNNWERRIVELGGPNYRKYERIADDVVIAAKQEGALGEGHKGYVYKYFGAARNLPGVKETLEEKQGHAKKKKYDYKGIDSSYYGYTEEDETELERLEAEAEKKLAAMTN